jgi:hypothetical protein
MSASDPTLEQDPRADARPCLTMVRRRPIAVNGQGSLATPPSHRDATGNATDECLGTLELEQSSTNCFPRLAL